MNKERKDSFNCDEAIGKTFTKTSLNLELIETLPSLGLFKFAGLASWLLPISIFIMNLSRKT